MGPDGQTRMVQEGVEGHILDACDHRQLQAIANSKVEYLYRALQTRGPTSESSNSGPAGVSRLQLLQDSARHTFNSLQARVF